MFLPKFVCLFVCLQDRVKSYERNFVDVLALNRGLIHLDLDPFAVLKCRTFEICPI